MNISKEDQLLIEELHQKLNKTELSLIKVNRVERMFGEGILGVMKQDLEKEIVYIQEKLCQLQKGSL